MKKIAISNLLSNPNGGFLTPEAQQTRKMSKKIEKNGKFCPTENGKNRDVNIMRHSITYRNYTVTYCQTPRRDFLALEAEKNHQKPTNFQNLENKQILSKYC